MTILFCGGIAQLNDTVLFPRLKIRITESGSLMTAGDDDHSSVSICRSNHQYQAVWTTSVRRAVAFSLAVASFDDTKDKFRPQDALLEAAYKGKWGIFLCIGENYHDDATGASKKGTETRSVRAEKTRQFLEVQFLEV